MDLQELLKGIHNFDFRSIARSISLVEQKVPLSVDILKALPVSKGISRVLGVTGPPGAGKSTLTDQLLKKIRASGKTVAVLAIDPSSPFSGGAILGDRIRMQDCATDPGIYIRSFATRGHLGGISSACADAIRILDAACFDYIIVETVGVGQTETEIVRLADAILLVLMPGLGDDIQNIKAGIMEIGDIFAINKSDREGADRTVTELSMMFSLGSDFRQRDVPSIVKTIASEGYGIDELFSFITKYFEKIHDSGELKKRRIAALGDELRLRITARLEEAFQKRNNEVLEISESIYKNESSLYTAEQELFKDIIKDYISQSKEK